MPGSANETKMLLINRDNVLNSRSFWPIRIIGWAAYILRPSRIGFVIY